MSNMLFYHNNYDLNFKIKNLFILWKTVIDLMAHFMEFYSQM